MRGENEEGQESCKHGGESAKSDGYYLLGQGHFTSSPFV